MHAVVRRQQQRAHPEQIRTGACGGNCNCNACVARNGGGMPPGQNVTVNQIAELLGRKVAGMSGSCKYNMIHLTNANRVAGILAGATETITENVQIGLCLQQVVIVTREVAIPANEGVFDFQNLMLANKQQWLLNRLYHQGLFNFDAECSCCLPGDCTTIGMLVSITAINRAAVLAANVDVYLIGPSVA